MLRRVEDRSAAGGARTSINSMPPSAAPVATKSDRERRSVSSPCATPSDSGIREISGRSCGISTTARFTKANRCAFSRFRTGPSATCGNTSRNRTFRSCRSTTRSQRKVVFRGTNWIPIDDPEDVRDGETAVTEWVRFRTLGCMPCTGAVKSEATTIEEIVAEAGAATRSERETRVIDHGANTMEDKKREGYF